MENKSKHVIVKVAALYLDKPVFRALFDLAFGFTSAIPFMHPGLPPEIAAGVTAGTTALAASLITSGFEQIRAEQAAEFIDELSKCNEITEDMLANHDFLHRYVVTYNACTKTRYNKKIRLFARLLITGVTENRLDAPEMDEFISILDDLSLRELEILLVLKRYYDDHPYQYADKGELENELQRASRFWDEFLREIETKLGLTAEITTSMLNRLNRTGLYENISGMYFDYTGGKGKLTSLFETFCHWLKMSGN